jgi:hypothetical protein
MAQGRLSALVVLRPKDGRSLTGTEAITSDTVDRYRPSPEGASRAAGYFRDAGFEVSEVGGISFSITGPRSLFEERFGERLEPRREGGVDSVRTEGGSLELSLDRLPPDVAGHVQAVTFTPPPDFGPGNP